MPTRARRYSNKPSNEATTVEGLPVLSTSSTRLTLRLLRNQFPKTCYEPERGPSVSFSAHHAFSPKGVAGLSFTARIERAQLHRARSARKKDSLAAPCSTLLRARVPGAQDQRGCPSSPPSPLVSASYWSWYFAMRYRSVLRVILRSRLASEMLPPARCSASFNSFFSISWNERPKARSDVFSISPFDPADWIFRTETGR